MKAIMVSEPGGPEVLRMGEVPVPEPGPGEVLVRVLSAGVGPWDAEMRSGQLPAAGLPFIPGADFAGLVVGDSGAEAAFEDGEPVYGYPGLASCYAEYVTCPSEQLAPIPSGLSAADAGAVPVDVLTAYQGLTDVLGIGAGDQVLITAAAGGVGHFAVQIARTLGAVVIATASPQHHGFVHKLGAAVVVDHTRPDWPQLVRQESGGSGPMRVLACAAPTLAGAASAAGDNALLATPVYADAYPDSHRVRWQQYNGEPRGSNLIRMGPWFDDGSLEVHISRRFFLADAAEAHREVEKGHTRGKLGLIIDEDLAAQLQV
jgi:NADPH:quinone reductase